MIIILIGIIIGLTLGLTGSGGALIAIPLAMTWLGLSLKEATSFSLVAVFFSGFLNLLGQHKLVHWNSVIWIIPFSFLGSFASLPLKEYFSDIGILILIALVSGFGMWSVWKSNSHNKTNLSQKVFKFEIPSSMDLSKFAFIGILMGVLTTLTGLGGGMLLVPIFISLLGFSSEEAVASSLVPISVTAFFSVGLQLAYSHINLELILVLKLVLGIGIIAMVLPMISSYSEKNGFRIFKKVFFSLVVIFSLVQILGETLLWK